MTLSENPIISDQISKELGIEQRGERRVDFFSPHLPKDAFRFLYCEYPKPTEDS